MPMGAGKYDNVCTAVREEAKARAVILIVLDGVRGTGMSVQGTGPDLIRLPAILEQCAQEIRASFERGQL